MRRPTYEALLTWLDPEASAVIYADVATNLDLEAFGVVFAVPPRVVRMLRDLRSVDRLLDAMLVLEDGPRSWLGAPALGSQHAGSSETYVLRPLIAPRAEFEAALVAAGFERMVSEGLTILAPRAGLPWKVAILEDDVVGFIPAGALGDGLDPLTAGRDMPASEIEKELAARFTRGPRVVLEIMAAGPLLHLDLEQELGQLLVHAEPWEQGLDVSLHFVPTDDPMDAITALTGRDTTLETDQIRALARRVAFELEGPGVSGRLQLTAKDLAVLQVPH